CPSSGSSGRSSTFAVLSLNHPPRGVEFDRGRADFGTLKQSFNTSAGVIEVLVDERSRIVSVYRFDAEHRPIAAAIESWDHIDLADLLARQAAVPSAEAHQIAAQVRERHSRW